MNTFGSNVYKYRKAAGLTQEELAQRLGYKNKASIGKIENGNSEVLVSMALRIARELNVDIMLLLRKDELPSDDFVPYLNRASEDTLRYVRKILDMPEKKSASDSFAVV